MTDVIEETVAEATLSKMQSNFGDGMEEKRGIDKPTPKAKVTPNLTDTLTGILKDDYNLDEEKLKALNAKY